MDRGLNDPKFVFSGLACSITAIALGALTQYVHERTTGEVNFLHEDLRDEEDRRFKVAVEARDLEGAGGAAAAAEADAAVQLGSDAGGVVVVAEAQAGKDGAGAGGGGGSGGAPQAGSTDASRRKVLLGVGLAAGSGVMTGLFVPAFAIACNDTFRLLRSDAQRPMTVYAAAFYFCLAAGGTAVAVNLVMFRRPFPGAPASSVGDYLRDNRHRAVSVGAGAMVAISNVLQFAGGQCAAAAAALLLPCCCPAAAAAGAAQPRGWGARVRLSGSTPCQHTPPTRRPPAPPQVRRLCGVHAERRLPAGDHHPGRRHLQGVPERQAGHRRDARRHLPLLHQLDGAAGAERAAAAQRRQLTAGSAWLAGFEGPATRLLAARLPLRVANETHILCATGTCVFPTTTVKAAVAPPACSF
jgi:hypothetical protein